MSMQMAELHYRIPPTYDAAAIAERAEALIHSGIEIAEDDEHNDTLVFFHKQHYIEYSEGSLPAQTAILATDHTTDVVAYEADIQQSWACEDAQERLQACTASCLATEMMARLLDHHERLTLFHGVLQALIDQTQPHAIVFKHSQQVIAPDAYLESCTEAPISRPGSLNVRFFRISNSEHDDMLMDTRGLDEIGLHDLQCHFRNLDPNDVSNLLYNIAIYIVENGAVIESGHTVEGIEPGSKWQCRFEDSLLEPKRVLLDLNPGSPNAAGNRR